MRQPRHASRQERGGPVNEQLFRELVLMVDVFAACIETGIMPTHGGPLHRKARELVDKSGAKPKRKWRLLLKAGGR